MQHWAERVYHVEQHAVPAARGQQRQPHTDPSALCVEAEQHTRGYAARLHLERSLYRAMIRSKLDP